MNQLLNNSSLPRELGTSNSNVSENGIGSGQRGLSSRDISSEVKLPAAELKEAHEVEKTAKSLVDQEKLASLYEWVGEAASIASKRVQSAILPVIDSVQQKLSDESLYLDIRNKISQAEVELNKILSQHEDTLGPLKKIAVFISEKGSHFLIELKSVATPIFRAAEKCIDACGTTIFGEKLYGQIKSAVSSFVKEVGQYVGNLIRNIFSAWNNQVEEQKERQSKQKQQSENLALRRENEDAKKASDLICSLKDKIEYFGDNKERFLSVNILDDRKKRDGLLKNQPDSLRTTLAISRPVFDPFPSREVREERAREDIDNANKQIKV